MVRGAAQFWGLAFGTGENARQEASIPYDPEILKEVAKRSGWTIKEAQK